MQIAHPDHIDRTHVPVSHYRVGAFWFLQAMPRNVLVSEVQTFQWWVSYAGDWVRTESFHSLEDAMEAAARFAREKQAAKQTR